MEVERSARVLDGSILVIDGVAGVQAQTLTVWKQIKKHHVSTIAFINKLDRDGANLDRCLKSIENKLNVSILPVQIPVGNESGFYGVIDLCSMTQVTWGQPHEIASSRNPAKPVFTSIPSMSVCQQQGLTLYMDAWRKRDVMIECLASIDDTIMEKYLSAPTITSSSSSSSIASDTRSSQPRGGSDTQSDSDSPPLFTTEELHTAIRRHCVSGSIIPALCGSSLKGNQYSN